MSKTKILFILILFFGIFYFAENSQAATTYYVDNAGSGCFNGSTNYNHLTRACGAGAETVYTTVQNGLNAVVTGNTIMVMSGSYSETPTTVATNVIVQSYTPLGAHLKAFTINHNNITLDGFTFDIDWAMSYETRITVSSGKTGWKVQNNRATVNGGSTNCGCITGDGTGQILNNYCSGDTRPALFTNGGTGILIQGNTFEYETADIFYLWGTNHIIKGNTVKNIVSGEAYHGDLFQSFTPGVSTGHIIEGNWFDGTGAAIDTQICNLESRYVAGSDISNWTIRNNVFLAMPRTCNVHAQNMKFYNNTFIACTHYQAGPITFYMDSVVAGNGDGKNYRCKVQHSPSADNRPPTGANWATYWEEDTTHTGVAWDISIPVYTTYQYSDGSDIRNNIFVGCGLYGSPVGDSDSYGWYIADFGLNRTFSNNYVSKGAAGGYLSKSGWNTSNGNINGGDPKFVSYAGNNFALQSNSSLIDVGATITNPTNYLGTSRPQGTYWDIGAYEYTGTTPPVYCGDGTCNGTETCSTCPSDCGTCPVVTTVQSLTLVNADTDLDIGQLTNGMTINLQITGSNLSIRANTSPSTVGSVKFGLDSNSSYRIESVAPYAILGDDPVGNYNPWIPSVGSHTVVATPYSGTGASGTAGTSLSLSFTVTADTTPPAAPTGVSVR